MHDMSTTYGKIHLKDSINNAMNLYLHNKFIKTIRRKIINMNLNKIKKNKVMP